MYYVPDGTKTCGYYECKKCGNRFLSLQTMEKIPCPDCEAEVDYEIGPGESLEDVLDTAVLLQRISGSQRQFWKVWYSPTADIWNFFRHFQKPGSAERSKGSC